MKKKLLLSTTIAGMSIAGVHVSVQEESAPYIIASEPSPGGQDCMERGSSAIPDFLLYNYSSGNDHSKNDLTVLSVTSNSHWNNNYLH
jgi:hypothetical protein